MLHWEIDDEPVGSGGSGGFDEVDTVLGNIDFRLSCHDDAGEPVGDYIKWYLTPDTDAEVLRLFYSTITVNNELTQFLSFEYDTLLTPISPLVSPASTIKTFGYSTIFGEPPSRSMIVDNSGYSSRTAGLSDVCSEYMIPLGLDVTSSGGFVDVRFIIDFLQVFDALATGGGFIWDLSGMPIAREIGSTYVGELDPPPAPFGAPPSQMVGNQAAVHHPSKGGASARNWFATSSRSTEAAGWSRFPGGVDVSSVPQSGGRFNCIDGALYRSTTPVQNLSLADHQYVCSCAVHALDFPCPIKLAVAILVVNYDADDFPDTTADCLLCASAPTGWQTLRTLSMTKRGPSFSTDGGSGWGQIYGIYLDATETEPDIGQTEPEYHLAVFAQSVFGADAFLETARGLMWCGQSPRDYGQGSIIQMPGQEPLYSVARKVTAT